MVFKRICECHCQRGTKLEQSLCVQVPVESDLRLITRTAGGGLHTRIISAVRFTELEVSAL